MLLWLNFAVVTNSLLSIRQCLVRGVRTRAACPADRILRTGVAAAHKAVEQAEPGNGAGASISVIIGIGANDAFMHTLLCRANDCFVGLFAAAVCPVLCTGLQCVFFLCIMDYVAVLPALSLSLSLSECVCACVRVCVYVYMCVCVCVCSLSFSPPLSAPY